MPENSRIMQPNRGKVRLFFWSGGGLICAFFVLLKLGVVSYNVDSGFLAK